MYKRKDKKVLPANVPLSGGVNPGGGVSGSVPVMEGEMGSKGDVGETHGGKKVPRGSRLTPERLAQMKIGDGFLSEEERMLFVDILYEFEGVLAFEDSEMGCLHESIEPPVIVHTVPHVPWQQRNLRLPKAMQEAAMKIIQEKLENGTLEYSQGPYRSRYFLVAKKTVGEWRFINDVQPMNKITIRDAGMPPSVDEFSEDFAGCPIASSIDFYSSYYQLTLAHESRDLTAFLSPIGLVRLTRLPMGWTNSVAVNQRVMVKILWRHSKYARPFIDDVGVRGPMTRYDDEEVRPGVRRFVVEHAEIVRGVLEDIWKSGMTISGHKCAFGMPGIRIVGMVCDADGRRPEERKVAKIVDWPTPRSVKDARAFIGICVYYRIFIEGFSKIAAPIIALFRKGTEFSWTVERDAAMVELKARLTTAPTLRALDFSEGAGRVFLAVDASTTVGWGAVLEQVSEDELRRPTRFESGVWSEVEKKYDAVKLECRGLMKALKKLRFYLFGRQFTVETDAQTLVWILNQPPNDLPNALLTRWAAYIRLFDFEVHHVPGRKNGAADALSRRGLAPEDEEEGENDTEDYFDARMNGVYVSDVSVLCARVYLHSAEYSGDDLLIGEYLTTLRRAEGMSDQDFNRIRKKSKQFLVRDGHLFKIARKGGMAPRRVICISERQEQIIRELHDDIGHRGDLATFRHVSRRYQWKGMYEMVSKFVRSCGECQRRKGIRLQEPLHPTWTSTVWEKVGIDVVYMPEGEGGEKYIVFARDDLSGWVEGRALRVNGSAEVAKFIFEDVICRHGHPERIVLDGGAENKGDTAELLELHGVKRIPISAYHPQSNGLVERGHGPIVDSLSKYCQGFPEQWPQYLSLALWADRIAVRRTTGYSAFRLMYGQECVLPVEMSEASWSTVNWFQVRTREDLIIARMTQLDERVLDEGHASERLERARRDNKEYFDRTRRLRSKRLEVGDLVLVHDTRIDTSRMTRFKLANRWYGPYCIREAPEGSTYYRLSELDGTELAESFAGDRLKLFYSREETNRESTPVANDCEEEQEQPHEIFDEITVELEPPPDE